MKGDIQRESMTVFSAITKDALALADFLHSLTVLEGPWDTEFQKRYCAGCLRWNCDDDSECPNEVFRNNPAWWLALPAAEVEL